MLVSLIYVSSATHLMGNDELLDILHVSVKNNGPTDVTGLLLYQGGNFMQVLEGPEEGVMTIFGKIKEDDRHKDIILISVEPIKEREFSDWQMAFVNLDLEAAKQESAYSSFLEQNFNVESYRTQPPKNAYEILLSFREHIR
jgi:hypothetical protein